MIDIRSSNQDYLDLIQQIRQAAAVPILVLSSSLPLDSKLHLLQFGANAFIEEPLNIDVCIAQIYALLHINPYVDIWKEAAIFGAELIISRHYRQVLINGKPLVLTRKEFDLFYCFAIHPGQVFSCEQLYCQVWNEDIAQGSDDTVKSHIKTLRKKLASFEKSYIHNVWGIGYKFVLEAKK